MDKKLIIEFLQTPMNTNECMTICTLENNAGILLTAGNNISLEGLKRHFIGLMELGVKPYKIAQALAAANNSYNKNKKP